MLAELRLPSRFTLSGVLIAVLLSATSAFAGALEDCQDAFSRRDYAEVLRLCRPLAEQGEETAEILLGRMYVTGQGVPLDYGEAMRWYRKAAEHGSAEGTGLLGALYLYGNGVPQDVAQALKLLHQAAERGDVRAKYTLANMYQYGRGVPQDYVLAHMWWNLLAAQGFLPAQQLRDQLASKMTPEQIAEAQRLAREWKPTKWWAEDQWPTQSISHSSVRASNCGTTGGGKTP
jgi:hypothetical protein